MEPMVAVGLGVGIVAAGLFALLYRRLGRFETRIHERFDYVNDRVAATDDRTRVLEDLSNSSAEKLGLMHHRFEQIKADHDNLQRNFQKFFRDPDLTRAYLGKTLGKLDRLTAEIEELGRDVAAAAGVPTNGNGKGARPSLPERNIQIVNKEYAKGETNLRSWPTEMTLAITTRCHVTPPCGICERNLHTVDDEFDLSADVIAKLVPVFPHLDTLYLHCGGEPTFSRYFRDVIELVDAPTKIRFNTHGLTLNEELADFLVSRRNVDCINVSLDASTPETHRKLRGSGWDRIITNLVRLREIKLAYGAKKPSIIVNMCITRDGLEDIPGLVDIAAEVGAEMVDYFHMNTGARFDWRMSRTLPGGGEYVFDYREQARFDVTRHDDLLEEAYRRAKDKGLNFNFVGRGFLSPNLTDARRRISDEINERHQLPPDCTAPWTRAVVGEAGQLRVCYFHDGSKDLIGDLSKTDFRTAWNSPVAQEIRRQMKAATFADVCKCTDNVCIFRGRA